MIPLAIALAVLGACCNAVSARLQHGGLNECADERGLRLAVLLRLARQPIWLAGIAIAGCGAALHATALGLAPLSVVQPIGILAFALTTVMSVRIESIRLDRVAVGAVAASTVGTIAFVLLAATQARATVVAPDVELRATVLVVGLVGGLAAVAALNTGAVRCLGFATASGVSFGFVSLLMRATLQQLGGNGHPFPLPEIAGIVVGILVGGWLVQHAYASGPPEVVIGCLTVIDPLVAVGLGVVLLGEAGDTPLSLGLAALLCAVVAAGGVVVLTLRRPKSTPPANTVVDGDRQLVAPGMTQHYDGSTK
ncbi:DMT family transporter [Kutzneria buriramensis]|uniref:Magnesium transporter NIPA n=1 Tax=Kutzneria buriramensis TaxID=1045776 RepID=A0A3E0H4X3_9PSEU|nr:DMT family transporter [Kutzneria buriramensis]REH38289.1 magnesium transporter NIPA [Kutzneria buriramensis]